MARRREIRLLRDTRPHGGASVRLRGWIPPSVWTRPCSSGRGTWWCRSRSSPRSRAGACPVRIPIPQLGEGRRPVQPRPRQRRRNRAPNRNLATEIQRLEISDGRISSGRFRFAWALRPQATPQGSLGGVIPRRAARRRGPAPTGREVPGSVPTEGRPMPPMDNTIAVIMCIELAIPAAATRPTIVW